MASINFIFDTRVDNFTRQDTLSTVDAFLMGDQFHQVATVNPEFLLRARKDDVFKKALNSCSLNVADGTGLHFAFWVQGKWLLSRMAGADLMMHILQQSQQQQLRVFCAVRTDGLSQWFDVQRVLKKQFPKLRVDGIDIGHINSFDMLRATIQDRIKTSDIVLCNFGAPHQEYFLAGLKNTKSTIRLAMGVGGSFDFVTHKIKRAPRLMRKVGLEWLWRFIQQPSRFHRIANAVILFPLLVLSKSR